MSLSALRVNLALFARNEAHPPDNLKALEEYIKYHPDLDSHKRTTREYISCKEGNSQEYSTLNGLGGWYYDNQTGEIKVNLYKPIKKYMKLFFANSRNDIPSNW